MKIGDKRFDVEENTYLMGILNVTPDSFSDGGRWNQLDTAVAHAKQMEEEGADILDVGGESTRPGYQLLSEEEEIRRVVPVISALKREITLPVSIDTYKAGVAKAAIEAGADLVNDIWGLKYDPAMAEVIANAKLPCCLMHNRKEMVYHNYLKDVCDDLMESVSLAKQAGIREDQIILDPGIGFGKTYEQNLYLMNHLEILKELGYPVLLGTSRKSMIGLTLRLPVTEREEGTLVTTVMGVTKGCSFVRVHDVRANKRAIDMTRAILNSGWQEQ